ncbi:glycosyl hydrolases family 18 domain-containing protein [Rhizoctonia solani AG-1 IA]|uniref:Glycosyl hydrolases family 18 domain-containing protein n=1 Tax=Thanatephorus cucumeris (strain AG1-IA) TaxID=983506 RepID=L8X1G8_THACA|nr:glycosyl hydrolases family 18 domain-containing protein [Rhizoctonia solani AG-1 IA]
MVSILSASNRIVTPTHSQSLGAWNKGKGGNGYLRGSRVWDTMGNVVILNNMTFMEVGKVLIYSSLTTYPSRIRIVRGLARAVAARAETKRLIQIQKKALPLSNFAGVLERKQVNGAVLRGQDGGEYVEYRPYFARDGSLSSKIWQLGWDSQSPAGIRYSHLSVENRAPIKDWQSHELVDYSKGPAYGANSLMEDPHTSLFLKDVSAATGTVATYSGIAGNNYCRGDVETRRLFNSVQILSHCCRASRRFAYGALARDGTITVASEDQQLLRDVAALKSNDTSLKVFLAVGGWGLGADPANMVAIATSASARTKLGTSGAAICQSYGLDGIDVEWAPGISATQWRNIIQGAAPGLKAANFNLSMSTPHSFWSSSGVNTVAADLSKAVDFASLISHDLSGAVSEYPNSLSKMSAAAMNIHKLGFPRGQIMMERLRLMPIRSRKLSDSTCTADGCGIVSGLGSTSECLSTTGIGRGTFPYFAISDRLNGGTLDEDSNGESTEIDGSAARYVTGIGYVFDYETPASVVEKARAATMLCLGGLSISALDQDNRKFELTTAIWGAGALVPTAAEIASTISGEPLTENGLVSVDFWDKAADQILAKYPSLSMQLNYQVMLLLGIRALDAVASSLYEYLKFSALSEDSFALYKTKALNWALANETGKGNDFWQCSHADSDFSHDTCPGGHNTRGADVNDVYWRLTDPGGFSNYLVESLGMDTSNLIIGDIYVGRNQLSSNATNVTLTLKYDDAVPETNATIIANSEIFEDDGTGRVRRVQVGNSSIEARHHVSSMPPYDPADNSEGFSPYDPDKDCRTLWHDVLLIDADKFFPNIKDGIQAYLDQYEEFKLSAINLASSPFETVESLAPSLYLTLTTLTSGNDTLYSTMQYIEQVKYDKALQDPEQARQAGIQLIIDIVLTLLSFVPFGGLVSGAARAARALVPVFRSARATRSLARGLEKALDGAMDARSLRSVDELLSPIALEGRGRIGKALDRIQEFGFSCDNSDYTGLALDMFSLAEPALPSLPLPRRSFLYNDTFTEPSGQDLSTIDSTSPIINPNESKRSEWSHLHSRAPAQVETCIWRPKFNAAEFKSKNYRSFCHDTSALYPMEWVDVDNNNEVKKVTYADCRPPNGNDRTTVAAGMRFADKDKRKAKNLPPDPKYCQCDHMFEGIEPKFTKADADIMCNQPEYKAFFQKVIDRMNSPESECWSNYIIPKCPTQNHRHASVIPGTQEHCPQIAPLIQPGKATRERQLRLNLKMEKRYRYMNSAADARLKTAKDLDVLVKGLSFQDPEAARLFATRYITVGGQTNKVGILEATNHANTERYAQKLERVKFRAEPAIDNTKVSADGQKVLPRRSERLKNKRQCPDAKTSNKRPRKS